MKKLISVIVCLMAIVATNGQTTRSAIHLNNGSIINGTIVDDNNQVIKLETIDGSIWAFEKSSITQVVELPTQSIMPLDIVPSKGFYNCSDAGLLLGNSNSYYRYNSSIALSLQMVNGYKFNKHFSAGIGVGVERFNSTNLLPTFGEVRWDVLHKSFSPYITVQGGYGLPLNKSELYYRNSTKYYGGLMFNASIGIKKYILQQTAITISAGYRYQENKNTYMYSDWEGNSYTTENKEFMNRFTMRVGLLFN